MKIETDSDRAGGGNAFYILFCFEGMVAKVAYHQNKIKYLLGNSGRAGGPEPIYHWRLA